MYPTSCIPPNLCWTPLCWSVFCFKEKLFFGQSWEYIGRSIGYNSQSTSEKHLWTWRFEFIFLETTPNPLETRAVFVVLVPPPIPEYHLGSDSGTTVLVPIWYMLGIWDSCSMYSLRDMEKYVYSSELWKLPIKV